ncbi:hypothetical protein AUC68_07035 [Methyloceanibacter methanicus]|uniref:Uncharacterized protein n=1 Tax=Methyloceanibacter methanicus TaxID=1774968 RepID=A0A1E3VZD6_9HYPH|nr:hypothetical protein [Methyloceanibacter methanicus]ODR98918.1 hypothetical protein AUC68_07035 [Methyloceanibacter methanicus]
MATDLATLRAFRDALLKARFQGRRSIRFDDQEVAYRSDSELAAAIADCESRIAALEGRKVKAVRFNTSKGL